MRNVAVRAAVAAASIAAGVIHFLVTPMHLHEFELFGLFFLALGVFQVLWAGVVMVRPALLVLLVGVLASAAVVALWAVSRTAGLPVGPMPGEAEPVGFLDTLASGLEVLIVVGGVYLLTRRARAQRPVPQRVWEEQRRAA